MIISSQGFGHFAQGLNNQDFGGETSRMLLVVDGCSGAKYSEVGTRLFTQLFLRKEECDNPEKFENNVKEVFDDLISMMEKFYPTREDDESNETDEDSKNHESNEADKNRNEFENDFIMENLLFTIISCFETENEFIVKLFGDGYIVTENIMGCISYIKFSYGKFPPYFAYKYCPSVPEYHDYEFKTFRFDKAEFSNVAIASDGIMPFAKGEIPGIDEAIKQRNNTRIVTSIRNQKMIFSDDVTIAMFGGINHET